MIEFRCTKCNKKLGMVSGKVEIKCPRCGAMNRIDTFKEQQKDCRLS